MAITYGFYNSMNGDRKYDAVQLSSIFDGVIRDGVFQSIGGYLATKPGTGMQVLVSPGKAWFDHTWTVNDADLPLDISQSDLTLSRYDAVVLETDATKSVRENSIKVIKGTPASAPQKPTLTNVGDVHQHPLAYILVPGGSTEIQAQNIDIMVGKSECPFVTSILESVSIEALLEKWEGEFRVWSAEKENDFQTWFDDLQSQMEGDVATNLQNQINKINQTTATEETKSLYGVPSDGTPDDVFQAINSIGDIKITPRSDLNDHWILCNGESADRKEYPELYNILPHIPSVWDVHLIGQSSSPYFCGKYLIEYNSSTRKYRYMDVTVKSWSNWLDIPQGIDNRERFYYLDGVFLMCPTYHADYYHTARSLSGPWTKRKHNPDHINMVMKLFQKVEDKYACILDFYEDTSASGKYIAITSNLESDDWELYPLAEAYGLIQSFVYADNKWAYTRYANSTRYMHYAEGQTPPAQSSGWKLKSNSQVSMIKKIDGFYYLYGYAPSVTAGFYKNSVVDFNNYGELALKGVTDFVKLGTTYVGYSSSKTGFSKTIEGIVCSTSQEGSIQNLLELNGKIYALASKSGGTSDQIWRILETDEEYLEWALLPSISFDKAYAYIRGK